MTIAYQTAATETVHGIFNFDTTDIGIGILLGTVPIGAKIVDARLYIQTAFNAGTNTINIGVTAAGVDWGQTIDYDEAAAAMYLLPKAYALTSPAPSARAVWVRYVQTGAAATAGKAHVIIQWTY